MIWWGWMIVGIALLSLEAATPGGLFALFFGLSALVVGGLTALGISGPAWMQWLLFTGLSVGALVLLRGPLSARLNLKGPGKVVDSLQGESAVVTEAIAAGGVGKVEMRGSSWSARNAAGMALATGQRCRVEKIDGLTVWVAPE